MLRKPASCYSRICNFSLVILCVLCLNVVILSLSGHYDIRVGFFHLTANGLFKPVLIMSSWFMLALLVCALLPLNRRQADSGDWEHARRGGFRNARMALIPLSVFILYCGSVQVNFLHHDWTHRHISAGLNSFAAILRLFATPQADGFYRPLTFISLWIDYRIFGSWYPGYHLQSIALHIVNALLVVRVAGILRFNRTQSLWAGLLYSVAAVHFEPVLWPAARFDLLAAGFTLGALILAIGYFSVENNQKWELPASLLCFAFAVMSKESGYCFPLLIAFFLCTYRVWRIPRPKKDKVVRYCSWMLIISAAMVLARVAVYGDLGGYPTASTAASAHFTIGLKAFTSILRVLPLSLFGVNTTSAAPAWAAVAVVLYAVFVFVTASACRGCCGRRELSLVACTFLAAIPVLNIAGWIGPSMQHSRYLYLPAIFSFLLLVSLIGKLRMAGVLLGSYFLINALGVSANIWSYRHMLLRSESVAESVRIDCAQQPGIKTIFLLNLPENPDGVFFFGSEVVAQLESRIPTARIIRVQAANTAEFHAPAGLVYQWSEKDQMLRLIRR
jgi:hypothetical protein